MLITRKEKLFISMQQSMASLIFAQTADEIFLKGTSESSTVASSIIATYFSIKPDYSAKRMVNFIKNSIVKDKNIGNYTLFKGYLQYDKAIFR